MFVVLLPQVCGPRDLAAPCQRFCRLACSKDNVISALKGRGERLPQKHISGFFSILSVAVEFWNLFFKQTVHYPPQLAGSVEAIMCNSPLVDVRPVMNKDEVEAERFAINSKLRFAWQQVTTVSIAMTISGKTVKTSS